MRKSTFIKAVRIMTAALGIAATACLVSLITLLIGGIKPEIFAQNTSVPSDPTALSSRLSETPDYGQSYVNNVIFIGDRTIGGITRYDVLKDGKNTRQVWTGESGTLSLDFSIDSATVVYPEDGTSLSIASATMKKRPDYVVITLGLENGVAYCTEEKFTEYYGKLIDSLKENAPDTKIILQSVFPVSKEAEKTLAGVTNKKIDEANRWIERIAEEKDVRYLHTAPILKNKSGDLDEQYDSGDGVTLNEAGYLAMLDYIRTHGYK